MPEEVSEILFRRIYVVNDDSALIEIIFKKTDENIFKGNSSVD